MGKNHASQYANFGSLRVDHTLTWKIKILGKQVEYGIKQIIEYLIPASFLKEMKIRNRKRLEHRK